MYLQGGEYSLVKAVDQDGKQLHTSDVEFGQRWGGGTIPPCWTGVPHDEEADYRPRDVRRDANLIVIRKAENRRQSRDKKIEPRYQWLFFLHWIKTTTQAYSDFPLDGWGFEVKKNHDRLQLSKSRAHLRIGTIQCEDENEHRSSENIV